MWHSHVKHGSDIPRAAVAAEARFGTEGDGGRGGAAQRLAGSLKIEEMARAVSTAIGISSVSTL